MELKDVLKKMKVGDLKKEIAKTNIKGISKLKKQEIIDLMLQYPTRFQYLIGIPSTDKHNKPAPKRKPGKPKGPTDPPSHTMEPEPEEPSKEDIKEGKLLLKMINEFKIKPTQKLLDDINNKAEFIDYIPDSEKVFDELRIEIKKFKQSKKKGKSESKKPEAKKEKKVDKLPEKLAAKKAEQMKIDTPQFNTYKINVERFIKNPTDQNHEKINIDLINKTKSGANWATLLDRLGDKLIEKFENALELYSKIKNKKSKK